MPADVHEREDFLSPKQVAHQLGLNVATVYRAVEEGRLPAVRLSGTGAIRIPASAIAPKENQ